MARHHVGIFRSLRTHLTLGASVLLVLAVAGVSYLLILHQERTLTSELEKTAILQGRNIALSSEKALLRVDPEFELFPLVTRLLKDSERIESVAIVDKEGIVQGHADLVAVGQPLQKIDRPSRPVNSPLLRGEESLYDLDDSYLLVTPVASSGQTIGFVHLVYSKADLSTGLRTAFNLTLRIGIVAVVIGFVLSLIFFTRISRPIDVMLAGVGRLGEGDLDARISMPVSNEFKFLAESFNDMAQQLRRAQDETIARERLEREFEIAAEIQKALIPKSVTPPDGFQIGHYYQSAMQVGGDYVDVIPIDARHVGFVIADVSGKGVSGLTIMAMVKILSHEFVISGASPREVVCSVNAALNEHIQSNMFVTFFAGILDTETSHVKFSNAGHNPLLIFDAETQSARYFRMEGVPLGVLSGDVFSERVKEYDLDLKPNDFILQYTDGINESLSHNGTRFGIDRLQNIVAETGRKGPIVTVDTLVTEEREFRGPHDQFDDITLLAIGPFNGIQAKVTAE